MNTNLLLKSPPRTTFEFGKFLELRLRVPIRIWMKVQTGVWENIQDPNQVTSHDLGSEQIYPVVEPKFEFVLPLGYSDGVLLAATGRIDTREPDLFLNMASSVVREYAGQRHIAELKSENEQFAEQAIASFEELSFLKCATGQLAKVKLKSGVSPLIETVLESLRSSIRAQTVQLVFAGEHQAHITESANLYRVSYAGQHWQHVSQLMNRFENLILDTPLVRNNCVADPELLEFEDLNNLIIVPVLHDGKLMGWLVAINQLRSEMAVFENINNGLNQDEFGTVEAMVLNAAASIIATHVANVELFKEQGALVTNMIRALVSALDAKDTYTCGHSERVAAYARMVAGKLGLDAEQTEEVYMTGLLHDIGKIGIGEETLNHPGELSESQFNIIKQHPHDGWAILHSIKQLEYVLPGVLFHHERLDGKGYPDGLNGDEIPMVARILGVVDAYDAMTSNRPYRKGMPHDNAAKILRNGAGEQWDAEVVATFLAAEKEVAEIRNSHYVSQRPQRKRGAIHARKARI